MVNVFLNDGDVMLRETVQTVEMSSTVSHITYITVLLMNILALIDAAFW